MVLLEYCETVTTMSDVKLLKVISDINTNIILILIRISILININLYQKASIVITLINPFAIPFHEIKCIISKFITLISYLSTASRW